jgi:hypothetical protein
MSTPATAQDVQIAFEKTKSAVMGSMLTRGDLQSVTSQVRMGLAQDLNNLHAENQVAMRQAVNSRAQLMQRLGAVEASLARLEQSLQILMSQQSKTTNRIGRMQPETGYTFQRI